MDLRDPTATRTARPKRPATPARRGAPLVLLVAVAGCAVARVEPEERREGVARAALLGGRPSGDDENAAVYIETAGEEGTLRCSGYAVSPRLVLSARHCFLTRKSSGVRCDADGTPIDLESVTDLEPPERVTVYVGANRAALQEVKVTAILTDLALTLCSSDLAFLVLATPAVPARTPLRRAPVRIGEAITVSGWGATGDDPGDAVPSSRSTLEGVPVHETGPGLIPAGTFAVGGNTVCFGDSGAVARIDGAAVGTYSRIDGANPTCSLEYTRNVFQGVASQSQLVERAFAAVGEAPWYADDPAPDAGPTESEGGAAVCANDDPCEPDAPQAQASSCAVPRSGASTSTAPWAALALAGSTFVALRRRRASKEGAAGPAGPRRMRHPHQT